MGTGVQGNKGTGVQGLGLVSLAMAKLWLVVEPNYLYTSFDTLLFASSYNS